MPTARAAYVHIGMPKTGSTAIQAACDTGRDVLSAQGFHYLSGDRNHSEWLSLAFWDEADALRLAGFRWHDGPAAKAHRKVLLAKLEQEIAGTQQNLILSAEGLSMFHLSEVEALRDFLAPHVDRIRIIAYLRDPLSWVVSAAQQATKWSGELIGDLFDAPRLPDYATRFAPWLQTFGADNISFHPFGSRDIVTDFSAAIGLSTPLPPGDRLNEALTHRSVILLSHMNKLAPPFIEARHNPFRNFDLVRDARLPGRRFTLPRETVATWRDALAAERDWANTVLRRELFKDPGLPDLTRDSCMTGYDDALDAFARVFMDKSRKAQNERALRMLMLSQKHRKDQPRACRLLDQAWLLTTDRWTMGQVAEEALEQDRGDRAKFFAKTRLMRRIEAPEPGDPPLIIGNPFDRPWRKFPSIDPKVSRGGPGEQRSPGEATRKAGRNPCLEPQALH